MPLPHVLRPPLVSLQSRYRLPRIARADRSRAALFADGLLASGSDAVLPFLPLYLVALGASATEVGLLSILGGLAGFVALFPGAALAQRVRSLKAVVLLGSGGVGRVGLLALAAIPFALEGRRAIVAVLVIAGIRALVGMVGHPAWTAIFAAVVPATARAKYAARRSLAISLVAMAAVPLMGLVVSRVGGLGGYQVAFLVAAVIGFGSTACYAAIREPEHREPPRVAGYRHMLVDGAFSRFLLSTGMLHASSMVAAPFLVLHLARDLGASAAVIGGLSTVEALAAVGGQAAVGALIARFGSRRVLVGSMALMPFIPLLWLGIGSPWHAVAPYVLTGIAWSTCNLAAFDLLLRSAPPSEIGRYAAAHQAMVLLAGFLGPVVGTALINAWGMDVMFIVSALGRAGALAAYLAPRIALGGIGRRLQRTARRVPPLPGAPGEP